MPRTLNDIQTIKGSVLVDGDIVIELEDRNEGLVGELDDVEDDQPLLHCSISRADESGFLEELHEDASFCTALPADLDMGARQSAIEAMMSDVKETIGANGSLKSLCERLSWLNPDDLASAPRL